MMKRFLSLFFVISSICACEDSPTYDRDCPTDVVCTEIFVSLLLEPLEDGKPVVLTSYNILNTRNNERYDFTNSSQGLPEGQYVAISDAQLNDIDKKGTLLRLRGKKTDGQDYELEFEVGHDCCHVIPISGPFVD